MHVEDQRRLARRRVLLALSLERRLQTSVFALPERVAEPGSAAPAADRATDAASA